MRFRSEWLTLFTLTVAVAGAVAVPRGETSGPAIPKRPDLAAAGIDDRPVGSIKVPDKLRTIRGKATAPHR